MAYILAWLDLYMKRTVRTIVPSHIRTVHFAMKKKDGRPNAVGIVIGESLRAHRLRAGMSQDELAGRLGVSLQQIQKYEKGTIRISAGRLYRISRIFDIPIGTLFYANAMTPSAESMDIVPVKLIPDPGTLKLLTAFESITHREIRRCLVDLADVIAAAMPKTSG